MIAKPTLRRHFRAQRHLGAAATRSIQKMVVELVDTLQQVKRLVVVAVPVE